LLLLLFVIISHDTGIPLAGSEQQKADHVRLIYSLVYACC